MLVELYFGLLTTSKAVFVSIRHTISFSTHKKKLPNGSTTVTSSVVSFTAVERTVTFSDNLPGLRILVAPSGFKESLAPQQVADCIEKGILRVAPEHTYTKKLPLHDGGEGFCRALVARYDGDIKTVEVTGPIGEPVQSHYGLIGADRRTAVLDMAAAGGLRLVPHNRRDPTMTTTYGVGELMRAALDGGCDTMVVGCGDSGTSDGGVGMLQALGVHFFDINGNELPVAAGGGSLSQLARISLENIHPRLRTDHKEEVTIEVVCNANNVLCGSDGVSRVYGPQKGASPEQVELLSSALENYARIVNTTFGKDISSAPGSGASGGLGAGLILLNARLRPRAEAINEYFDLDQILKETWDCVFTAEGAIDYQSIRGKMTAEVARQAKASGAQVIALAGTIGDGADVCYEAGIRAFMSIIRGPSSLDDAINHVEALLTDSAEGAMRLVMVGMKLAAGRKLA